LRGIRIMLRATGAVHAMIGVEDDKMEAIRVIEGDHLRDTVTRSRCTRSRPATRRVPSAC
jgi:hypothetical protein